MEESIRSKIAELISVAKRASTMRFQTGTGGNISVRLDVGDAVIIKPSGVGFFECNEDNLPVVDLEGKILEGGPGRHALTFI